MFNFKLLPALALAAALPLAAQARTNPPPVQGSGQQQYLVGDFGNGQVAANFHGRATEANVPAGLYVLDIAPEYAAVNTGSTAN
jgi:hypothetical protein